MADKQLERTQEIVHTGLNAVHNSSDLPVTETNISPYGSFPSFLTTFTSGFVPFIGSIVLIEDNPVVWVTSFALGSFTPMVLDAVHEKINPISRPLKKAFGKDISKEAIQHIRGIQKRLGPDQNETISLNGLIDDSVLESTANRHGLELNLRVYSKKICLIWSFLVEDSERWDRTLSDIITVYSLEEKSSGATGTLIMNNNIITF